MADKQKYNFLTALLRQVKEAGRDGDELYQEWCDLVRSEDAGDTTGELDELRGRVQRLEDRTDALQQWLASLEAGLEDMEQTIELIAGEEADSDDDGMHDTNVRGHEPRVGGDSRDAGRSPPNLAGAGDGQVARRHLAAGMVPGTKADPGAPMRVMGRRVRGTNSGT